MLNKYYPLPNPFGRWLMVAVGTGHLLVVPFGVLYVQDILTFCKRLLIDAVEP